MDHITQLKAIRVDAIERLRRSQDFKLAKKLGLLLLDLGEKLDEPLDYDTSAKRAPFAPFAAQPASVNTAPAAPADAKPNEGKSDKGSADSNLSDLTNEDVIDELVAEIENDATLIADVTKNDQSKSGSKSSADVASFPVAKAANGSAA
ncbi:MAG: hypothetical protein AAGF28_07335 [Pseudomonadota bacterium]